MAWENQDSSAREELGFEGIDGKLRVGFRESEFWEGAKGFWKLCSLFSLGIHKGATEH